MQGDDISVITPSEHDGGYSLNYEARRNASKLNQAAKTAKAYKKRINACHYHQSKGLKKEPNDTNGPDLATKIRELRNAIRNAEREKAKAEARIAKLREGGVNVDEYIDVSVYAQETTEATAFSPVDRQRGGDAENTEWPAENTEWPAEENVTSNEQVGSPTLCKNSGILKIDNVILRLYSFI